MKFTENKEVIESLKKIAKIAMNEAYIINPESYMIETLNLLNSCCVSLMLNFLKKENLFEFLEILHDSSKEIINDFISEAIDNAIMAMEEREK